MDNQNVPISNVISLESEREIMKIPCDADILDRLIFEEINLNRKEKNIEEANATTKNNIITISLVNTRQSHFAEFWKSTQIPIKATLISLMMLCAMTFVLNPDNYLKSGYWLPTTVFIVTLALGAIGQWFGNLEKIFGYWQLQKTQDKIFKFEWTFIDGRAF